MKQRVFLVFLALCMLFGLCSCGSALETAGTTRSTVDAESTAESLSTLPIAAVTEPTYEALEIVTTSATEEATTPPTEATTEPATEATTAPAAEPHVHIFREATCLSPGMCECGETESSAKGHNYVSGFCTACGAEDPNHNVITYILNIKSKVFHRLTCRTLPTNNRQDTTMTREEILEQGYKPCGNCNP